jgi:hypothetical protein
MIENMILPCLPIQTRCATETTVQSLRWHGWIVNPPRIDHATDDEASQSARFCFLCVRRGNVLNEMIFSQESAQ